MMKKTALHIITALSIGLAPALIFAESSDTDFKAAIDKMRTARQEFRTARDAVKTATAVNRVERQARNLEKSKTLLTRLIDIAIKHSERVKTRISNIKFVDNALKTQVIAEIDGDIAKLNDLKARVAAATTTDGVKALAEELKTHRKDIQQVQMKKWNALLIISRVERQTIVKVSDRIAKVEAKIAEAATAGKDVSGLTTHLNLAKSALETSKSKLAEARAVTIASKEDFNKVLGLLKDVRTSIKSVYDHLKELYTLAKGVIGTPVPTATPSPTATVTPTVTPTETPSPTTT